MVIDWFYDNKSWLEREDFRASLESGVVELQEERLEFTFEGKGDCVEIAITTFEPFDPELLN